MRNKILAIKTLAMVIKVSLVTIRLIYLTNSFCCKSNSLDVFGLFGYLDLKSTIDDESVQ